jgi:hypothetical protein
MGSRVARALAHRARRDRMGGASWERGRLDRHLAGVVAGSKPERGTDVVLRRSGDRTVLHEVKVDRGSDQRVRGDNVPAAPAMLAPDPLGQPVQASRLIRPQLGGLADHAVEPPWPT